MSNAPLVEIDLAAFWRDPYPALAAMRRDHPIAHVPQLGATLFTRRAHIVELEKLTEVFSSHQPQGLMNRLMGLNMMRKDGAAHIAERKPMLAALGPQAVRTHWEPIFRADTQRVLDALAPLGRAELVADCAMPVSAHALRALTGLVNMRWQDMDAWSQAMIDGIANYAGDPAIEARCHAATAGIDACITEAMPRLLRAPDPSLLSVMLRAGLPEDSVRANIKLSISGGQNEPRDAIAGAVWALLAHPAQLASVRRGDVTWRRVFDEYVRWISPIAMSPRRVAQRHTVDGVTLEPEDRVFFMFGSANRDEAFFDDPDRFDLGRNDSGAHIAFGAGPHYCAGAAASKSLIAEVALPAIFERLPGLRLAPGADVRFGGWAFRGPLSLPVCWG
ncbi:cytochrome P450 [Ideonella sp. A 288]|uniref:cytochrome P450 n=1 Tax=Ideonella sp. A 288 TaxID=1962181 RepID=UPI000B4B5AFF|nr:cytochrome P450 [Ideonella sp. A 288]